MLDFEKWARRDEWFLEECAMLLLGLEPFVVYYLIRPKQNAKGFEDLYETARRSALAGTLKARLVRWPSPRTLAKDRVPRWQYRWMVKPRDSLAWAREKGYPIPQELEEAVHRFHTEPQADPKPETPRDRSARLRARHRELTAAKDPHPTKTLAEEEGLSRRWVRQLMKPKARNPR